MKNINNDPKHDFNLENERGIYLIFFGETHIFWINIKINMN
jgi:hypothetical protein